MKSSIIAFFITAIQLGVIVWGVSTHVTTGIYALLTSYSPIYLVRALLSQEDHMTKVNGLYFLMVGYHVIKYFIIIRANTHDDANYFKLFTILFEITYLAFSCYLLF